MMRINYLKMIVVAVVVSCSTPAFARCWPTGAIPAGQGKDGDTCCNGAQMNRGLFGWSCPDAPSRPPIGAATGKILKGVGAAVQTPVPPAPVPATPPQRLDALTIIDMSRLSALQMQTDRQIPIPRVALSECAISRGRGCSALADAINPCRRGPVYRPYFQHHLVPSHNGWLK
jgi:hypothetical protein